MRYNLPIYTLSVLPPTAYALYNLYGSASRFYYDSPWVRKERVVVVGYGWGAHAFVNGLDRSKYSVQVVSERTARFNQPEMIGTLQPSYTSPPSHVAMEQDTAVSLDAAHQRIVGTRDVYPYDYAVIAVGSEANDFRVPGVRDHCVMCKTEEDLEHIQARLREGVTDAVVMGAGPTGLELACRLKGLGLGVTVYEAGTTILPGFSPAFQDEALRRLRAKCIDVRTGSAIQEVTATSVTLRAQGTVPCAPFKIWTCGIQPAAFVRAMTGGRPLAVDEQLRLIGHERVFGLGDCIAKPPPTAQNAKYQGEYLATLFNKRFQGHDGYTFQEMGRMLDMNNGLLIEVFGCVFFLVMPDVDEWRMLMSL